MPKHEQKTTLESKPVISKLNKKAVVEKLLRSEDNDHWNEELHKSQAGIHKNTSNKTKNMKLCEKKPESKEMKPKKVLQSKECEVEKAHSKGEKSKSFQFSEKKTEKYSHSSNNEKKKVSIKNEESPPKQSRHNKNDVGHGSFPKGMEKTAETLSGEESDTPAMSFESYLSYDQVSSKRKKKSNLTNEPPKKVQVCKQYCNLRRSSSEGQNTTMKEEDIETDVSSKYSLKEIGVQFSFFLFMFFIFCECNNG